MPDVPKVVVITRTRSRPALLRRAMNSVLGQSFGDWQHVLVNDGGDKAELEAVAAEFKEAYAGRLRILHADHKGMQEAANSAIRESDSAYIVIHDDDDAWDPDFLQETTTFLDETGPDSPYQGVITRTMRILEADNGDGTFSEKERTPYIPLREISLFRTGYENPFPPIAFLYRRTVHERIGFFNPRWDMVADLDFNFRFLREFEIGVINRPLAFYHWRDKSADGIISNTVTRHRERHGRYLNELKNHYLRQADTAREAAMALGFQMSAYAVENQWMTTEIREKTIEARQFLVALLDKVEALQQFDDKALWPKLTDDLIPRMEELQKALTGLDDLRKQLDELGRFNHEALWPKLEKDFLPRMAEMAGSVQALHGQLAESVRVLHEQLAGQSEFHHTALWPKIEELLAYSQSALWPKLEELLAFTQSALWPKLEALENSLAQLRQGSDASWEKQVDIQKRIEEIQLEMREDLKAELRALREETQGQWQLGRLRIQWLPKTGKATGGPAES